MQFQPDFGQGLSRGLQRLLGLDFTSAADQQIIGVAHEVIALVDQLDINLVQIDVGQQRRDDRPLRSPGYSLGSTQRIEDSGLKPSFDQI